MRCRPLTAVAFTLSALRFAPQQQRLRGGSWWRVRSAWPCPDGCVQVFSLGRQLRAVNQLARIVSGSARGCLHFVLSLHALVPVLVPMLVGWATGCLFCDGAACAGTACVASIPTVVPRCARSPARCSLPGDGTTLSSVVVEAQGFSGGIIGAHPTEIHSGM